MTRPSTDIPDDWAQDATWTSGPRAGDNTKLAPSDAQRKQGHVGGLNFFGDIANWLHNLVGGWVRYTDDRNFAAMFGDGNDGNVTISSNTTLTRDMFYNDLTINSGIVLTSDGYRIFVAGTLDMKATSVIRNNGQAGSGATGGVAGSQGSIGGGVNGGTGQTGVGGAGGSTTDSLGGSGGAGGNGLSAGGAGGTATAPAAADGGIRSGPSLIAGHVIGAGNLTLVNGGAGGGGGGGDGGNTGGGGGGGGGAVIVSARSIDMAGTASIEADGGAGAAGTASDCGGGGGGGGGLVIVLYRDSDGAVNTSVVGGSGGASGGGSGSPGTQGNSGTAIELEI